MSKKTGLEFKTVLFCDDVRTENNGKLMIIGTYGRNIAMREFPATLVLQCVVVTEANEACDQEFEFRLMVGDKEAAKRKGRGKFGEPGSALLSIPNLVVEAAAPLTIKMQVRFDGSAPWRDIGKIPMELAST